MYEEDEDIEDMDFQFRYAEADNADIGLGGTVSKEEVAEHNRDFEVSVLKEHTNNVKRKVDTVEENVKGVASKVVDVEGKVSQTANDLEDLKAKVEALGEKQIEPVSRGHLEINDDTLSSVQDIDALVKEFEEKKKEQIIAADRKKSKGTVQLGQKDKKEKGENRLVSGFKDGVLTVLEVLAKLLGIFTVIISIVIVNYLINTTATPPDNLAPLVDWIRPGWDWLLAGIGKVFNYLMNYVNK